MKIAYLSGSTIPSGTANSIHVIRMCTALAKRGHLVTLYARKLRDDQTNPWDFYGIGEFFSLKRIPVPELPDRAPVRKILRAIRYSKLVANLASRGEKPDLFYGRDLMSLARVAKVGVPFVYEVHEPPKNSIMQKLESKLFNVDQFSHVVAISEALRKEYLNRFSNLKPNRIIVAPDAASPIDINSTRRKSSSDAFRVGYVGNLYPGRGIDILLKAAEGMPEVEFHFVGGRREDLNKMGNFSIGGNTYFHGMVAPRQIPEVLLGFDALVAPYQRQVGLATGGDTSSWMSPLKIFEYMASGRPMIASDLPVLREVLKDGHNALLVSPDNVHQWRDAIHRLRTDKGVATAIARQAQEEFLQLYTWEKRADQVMITTNNQRIG